MNLLDAESLMDAFRKFSEDGFLSYDTRATGLYTARTTLKSLAQYAERLADDLDEAARYRMTRKDYKAIAEVLLAANMNCCEEVFAHPEEAVIFVIRKLCEHFARDKGHFSPSKFIAACGYNQEVVP